MLQEPLSRGKVVSLCINGLPVSNIRFLLRGPSGDKHFGLGRALSGHDGAYLKTSSLAKGATVFNLRSWTGLSAEEIKEVETELGCDVPPGILLENITVSGIPLFSRLPPMSRLVFPHGKTQTGMQAILLITEENGPCRTVGQRLEDHHGREGLKTDFIRAAQHKRGVMGLVYSAGEVNVGDDILLYGPVRG